MEQNISNSNAHPIVTFDDINQLPTPPRGQRIHYADNPLTFGELRMPTPLTDQTGLHPIVVVIHGGCWQSENDLAHIEHVSAALTHAGIATWTIEFRRIGDENGGWTGTFDDVSAAADYVRILSQQFPIDIKRVVFLGHSAGGHLALWLAARRNLPAHCPNSPLTCRTPLIPCCVVSLAGITDLRSYGATAGYCNDSVAALLGGKPDQVPDRYAQTSPIELLPFDAPVCILHGNADTVVPLEQSKSFLAVGQSSGSEVQLSILEDVGHFDLIAPYSAAWRHVEAAVLGMLKTPGT